MMNRKLFLRMNSGGSAPFDPSSIPGLVAWYESDTGATPSSWTDKSGNGNTLLQAVAGFRPTVLSPDPDLKSPQGSVDFEDPNINFEYLAALTSGTLDFGTGDFYAVFYAKILPSGGGFLLGKDSYSGGAYAGWFMQYNDPDIRFATRNSGAGMGNYLDAPVPAPGWYVITVTRTAGVLEILYNNISIGSMAEAGATDVNNASDFKLDAADDVPSPGSGGKFAALLIYRATATPTNLLNLTNYLIDKYRPDFMNALSFRLNSLGGGDGLVIDGDTFFCGPQASISDAIDAFVAHYSANPLFTLSRLAPNQFSIVRIDRGVISHGEAGDWTVAAYP